MMDGFAVQSQGCHPFFNKKITRSLALFVKFLNNALNFYFYLHSPDKNYKLLTR